MKYGIISLLFAALIAPLLAAENIPVFRGTDERKETPAGRASLTVQEKKTAPDPEPSRLTRDKLSNKKFRFWYVLGQGGVKNIPRLLCAAMAPSPVPPAPTKPHGKSTVRAS